LAAMTNEGSILIVDDDEAVRRSYLAALSATDCETAVAADGEQALSAMRRHPYDVVLLDLRMPGMDGLSVLRRMKQSWPESEVVIITGYPSVESAKEAVRLGAADYLSKPVGPDEIVITARDAITRKQWTLRENLTRSIP
jgi:DNA-binding NtrC family response regulator